MALQQQVLVEREDRIETNEKGPDHKSGVVRGFEGRSCKRVVHRVEHAGERGLESIEPLLRGWMSGPRIFDLQVRECILKPATSRFALPEQRLKITIQFGAANQIFEGLASEPSSPISAKAGTCQQDEGHGVAGYCCSQSRTRRTTCSATDFASRASSGRRSGGPA